LKTFDRPKQQLLNNLLVVVPIAGRPFLLVWHGGLMIVAID